MPFPSPSSIPQNRGGGLGRRRHRFRRPWVSGRGGEEGKRGSGVRGIDSLALLGSGRGEGAGRREPAAAGGNGGGGGAVGQEGRLGSVVRWCGWPWSLGGPFIAELRRCGGRGGEVGRRAVRNALMASRHGGAGGDAAQRRHDASGQRRATQAALCAHREVAAMVAGRRTWSSSGAGRQRRAARVAPLAGDGLRGGRRASCGARGRAGRRWRAGPRRAARGAARRARGLGGAHGVAAWRVRHGSVLRV